MLLSLFFSVYFFHRLCSPSRNHYQLLYSSSIRFSSFFVASASFPSFVVVISFHILAPKPIFFFQCNHSFCQLKKLATSHSQSLLIRIFMLMHCDMEGELSQFIYTNVTVCFTLAQKRWTKINGSAFLYVVVVCLLGFFLLDGSY